MGSETIIAPEKEALFDMIVVGLKGGSFIHTYVRQTENNI